MIVNGAFVIGLVTLLGLAAAVGIGFYTVDRWRDREPEKSPGADDSVRTRAVKR